MRKRRVRWGSPGSARAVTCEPAHPSRLRTASGEDVLRAALTTIDRKPPQFVLLRLAGAAQPPRGTFRPRLTQECAYARHSRVVAWLDVCALSDVRLPVVGPR